MKVPSQRTSNSSSSSLDCSLVVDTRCMPWWDRSVLLAARISLHGNGTPFEIPFSVNHGDPEKGERNFVLPSKNGLGIAVYRPRVAAQDPHHPAPLTRVNHTTAPRRKRARAPIKYMDDSKTIRWSNSRALISLGTAEGRSSDAAIRLGARLQVNTYQGSSSQEQLHATRPTLNQEIHGRTLSWRRLVGSGR
jgi:hypothetical protein